MRVEADYEDLLRLFNKYKVKYCIIGAYAIAFYAKPRYTKDIDILVEPNVENARRIIKSINDFGFKNLGLTKEDFSQKNKIIQLGYEPLRVDILTSIEGCTFEKIWKNKKTARYGKQKVFFIGINELIKNKSLLRRKQDEADLEMLLKTKRRVQSCP